MNYLAVKREKFSASPVWKPTIGHNPECIQTVLPFSQNISETLDND